MNTDENTITMSKKEEVNGYYKKTVRKYNVTAKTEMGKYNVQCNILCFVDFAHYMYIADILLVCQTGTTSNAQTID